MPGYLLHIRASWWKNQRCRGLGRPRFTHKFSRENFGHLKLAEVFAAIVQPNSQTPALSQSLEAPLALAEGEAAPYLTAGPSADHFTVVAGVIPLQSPSNGPTKPKDIQGTQDLTQDGFYSRLARLQCERRPLALAHNAVAGEPSLNPMLS